MAVDSRATPRHDYAACSGCSLCLLVCPVWRATRDPRLTPEGRAKALQSGAAAGELAASALACTLCAACEPVCPEHIDLIGMTLDLRRELGQSPEGKNYSARVFETGLKPAAVSPAASVALICGPALNARPLSLTKVAELVKGVAIEDRGEDIALALVAGAAIPQQRLDRFLAPLKVARTIVVDDGLWLRHLRRWLPGIRLIGLGEVLSSLAGVRRSVRATDLYVVESRAYHADYERLVRHYDHLRRERGCSFNLDLQRIAIPARSRNLSQSLGLDAVDDSAQVSWILKGRKIERIVVESMDDAAAFESSGGLPVVHLAELADH